jgi:hypothetical protein
MALETVYFANQIYCSKKMLNMTILTTLYTRKRLYRLSEIYKVINIPFHHQRSKKDGRFVVAKALKNNAHKVGRNLKYLGH